MWSALEHQFSSLAEHRWKGDRGSNAGGECARHGLSGSHMPGCK